MKIFTLLFLPLCLFASSRLDIFCPFKNRIFIETGTWVGEGVEEAIKCGFEEIHSIELSESLYQLCKNKFAHNPEVHLWLGDSSVVLGEVLQTISEPCTFWLDGHYVGGGCPAGGENSRGAMNTPILQELEAIRNHPIKTHTILIDDLRNFGTPEFDDIPFRAVLDLLHEINPNYTIRYLDGYKSRDVLVAEVP